MAEVVVPETPANKIELSVLLKCTMFNGLSLLLTASARLKFCPPQTLVFYFIYNHPVKVCTSIPARLYLICTRIIVFDIYQF